MNIPEKFLVASIVVKMAPCVHIHFLKLASHLYEILNVNMTQQKGKHIRKLHQVLN